MPWLQQESFDSVNQAAARAWGWMGMLLSREHSRCYRVSCQRSRVNEHGYCAVLYCTVVPCECRATDCQDCHQLCSMLQPPPYCALPRVFLGQRSGRRRDDGLTLTM